MSFVKLDCGLLNSSLWSDRDAREIFLTALLLAVPFHAETAMPQLHVRRLEPTGWEIPPGWYGIVEAAGIGIVARSLLDVERGLAALERLGSPDADSRSRDFEGRRLVRVDGGFLLLNYFRFRDKDHTAAVRQRRFREKNRTLSPLSSQESSSSRQKDPDASAPSLSSSASASASACVTRNGVTPLHNAKLSPRTHPEAQAILEFLNATADRDFRPTAINLRSISAKLREAGVDAAGVQQMISRQCTLWKPDPKMSEYLRPSTLFGPKFGEYYDNRDLPVPHDTTSSKPATDPRRVAGQVTAGITNTL